MLYSYEYALRILFGDYCKGVFAVVLLVSIYVFRHCILSVHVLTLLQYQMLTVDRLTLEHVL